jgi:hypothetical protein
LLIQLSGSRSTFPAIESILFSKSSKAKNKLFELKKKRFSDEKTSLFENKNKNRIFGAFLRYRYTPKILKLYLKSKKLT